MSAMESFTATGIALLVYAFGWAVLMYQLSPRPRRREKTEPGDVLAAEEKFLRDKLKDRPIAAVKVELPEARVVRR